MTPFQRRRNRYVNRMAEDMQIRNLAARTIDSYTWHVDKFCSHFAKMPDELGPEEIRQYQIFLVHEKKASWSFFNQAVCALRFLYEVTLGKPWPIKHIPFGKRPKRLPVVLSDQEALGDQRRLGSASRWMANYFWVLGEQDRAIECGRRALDIAAPLGDFALQVGSAFALGLAYHAVGDYARAIELFRRNAESLTEDAVRQVGTSVQTCVVSLAYLMLCLAELGEFAEGFAKGVEAVKIAEALEPQHGLILAYRGVGYLHLLKGDLDKAVPLLERSLQLCRALDLPGYVHLAHRGHVV